MSESAAFHQEIQEQTCVECPLRLIAPDVWEQCVQSNIETPYDLSTELQNRTFELNPGYTPPGYDSDPRQLDAMLSDIHENVMTLFDEDKYRVGGFFLTDPSDPHGALELSYTDDILGPPKQVPESEFSDTARHVLGCLRKNQTTGCMNKQEEEPVFNAISGAVDLQTGINVLGTVARHGSDEEVRNLLSKLYEQTLASDNAMEMAAEIKALGLNLSDDSEPNNLRDGLRVYATILGEYIQRRDG